jgi:hypothetical protein
MIVPMVQRLLRQGLVGTVLLGVGLMIFQFVNPFIADALGGAQGLAGLIEQLPPSIQALAQISPEFMAISGLPGYLSLSYDHPLYHVLVMSAVVGFSGRSIAGEVGSGTLAMVLSRPIRRSTIFLSRVAALLVLAISFGLAGPIATWIGLQVAQPVGEVRISQLLSMAVLGTLLAWSVGAVALLASSLASSAGRVVGWATGILVVSYFVDYFSELWSVLDPLTPFSLFRYFDTTRTMVDARVPAESYVVLGGGGVIAAAAGLLIFLRRDFEI